MKLLFVGNYDPTYNRNHVLLSGLRTIGVQVKQLPYKRRKHLDRSTFVAKINEADAIYVPCFSHQEVVFLKKYCPHKTLIFDPLVSKYLTKVFDYQVIRRYSIRAFKNYWKDKRAFSAADVVLADTAAHAAYFSETFGVDQNKLEVLPVGVNTNDFRPEPSPPSATLKVGFYGSFAPLQGVNVIVKAAALLRKHRHIHFDLLGAGFDFEKTQRYVQQQKLQNVTLHGWQSYEALPSKIAYFNLCLGIFGKTQKAKLVIPNKIYHYAACAKPIITMYSPAIGEAFTHKKNAHFCAPSSHALATSILSLSKNKDERNKLGDNALSLMQSHFSHHTIAHRLIRIIEQKVS